MDSQGNPNARTNVANESTSANYFISREQKAITKDGNESTGSNYATKERG